jgi:hypothetical protein
MTPQSRTALFKLIGCSSVSLLLLLLWYLGRGTGFEGLAIATFILVGAPTTLLVAMDTGRVFTRNAHLGKLSLIASRVPQILLGTFACGVAVGGMILTFLGTFSSPLWQFGCAVASALAFLYGLSNLRAVRPPQS